MITKSVGQLGPARRDMERLLLPVPLHHHSHRHARIEPHDLLDIFETLDRASVDAKDHIARLDTALFCRTSRLHLTDFGRSKGLAVGSPSVFIGRGLLGGRCNGVPVSDATKSRQDFE
jgi:hypothetical protein